MECDGVVGVAQQRAQAVVMGSPRVSEIALVSTGCGLISMKVP